MTEKIRIMFVCLGNICRSPMAECIMKKLVAERGMKDSFVINSSATSNEEAGNGIYYPAAQKLKQAGIPLVEHRATPLSRYDGTEYDYFVGMEERNIKAMKRILGSAAEGKIIRLLDYSPFPRDISDPWWTGNFDAAYRDIYEGCESLLEHVSNFGKKVSAD